VLFSDIDNEKFNYIMNQIVYDVEKHNDNYKKKVNLEALYNKIDSVIEDWYWYDKKLTKLYLNTNMSMRDISKETKISLSSIFNTLTNAKEKIRKESEEEYKKYKS
jgi:DNA-directed RNA polymerase specialized sigma subunit